MASPVTNIPIPSILEINNGAINKLESILVKHRFSSALMFFDDFTFTTYGLKIKENMNTIKLKSELLPPNLDVSELIKIAFSYGHVDVIIAMGGGSVIDYGKYIAFSKRLPFISIPTTASNDGFASSNSSLMIDEKKTSVPARVPYGIIADLNIIENAPSSCILAGIGDLMSNITALYDWEFEEQHGVSQVNAFSYMLSKKAVNSFVRTPMNDIKSPILLKELISSLTLGGISTVISGNSAPISGAEHLISHALDKYSKKPVMHGIQVGIATYLMAMVQEHRTERMVKVFTRTGFFAYVKEMQLEKDEYRHAIEMAPSIKPNRYTYLHDKSYLEKALYLLEHDPILNEIFS